MHAVRLRRAWQTAYLTPETVLTLGGSNGKKKHSTLVCQIESQPGCVFLRLGDMLHLTRPGAQTTRDESDQDGEPSPETAQIGCTLPQVIEQVQVGARVWFDDGRIGGVVRQTRHDRRAH